MYYILYIYTFYMYIKCIYIYIYICMYVCMYAWMYVYIYYNSHTENIVYVMFYHEIPWF